MIKKIGFLSLTFWLTAMLSACGSEPQQLVPAPLGDRAALEKLADAYTKISDTKLAVSPMTLMANERHKFVTEVFAEAGYDYSGTLKTMAGSQFDNTNQLHKDMAELALMPHRSQRLANMAPAEIYAPEELMDVAVIERKLNQF